jgi:hypothetical protein
MVMMMMMMMMMILMMMTTRMASSLTSYDRRWSAVEPPYPVGAAGAARLKPGVRAAGQG